MRNIEITNISKKSIFKTTIYLLSIPLALMMVVGLITIIVSIMIGEPQGLIFGIPYLIMPVVIILIYALMSMLVALVYNMLAKRFGGLVLTIETRGEDSSGPSMQVHGADTLQFIVQMRRGYIYAAEQYLLVIGGLMLLVAQHSTFSMLSDASSELGVSAACFGRHLRS